MSLTIRPDANIVEDIGIGTFIVAVPAGGPAGTTVELLDSHRVRRTRCGQWGSRAGKQTETKESDKPFHEKGLSRLRRAVF